LFQAASDLDVPWGLHNSIGLFTVFYLSGLFSIRELHDAAVRIQKAYRSYRFFRALKKMLQDARSEARTSDMDKQSLLMRTYVVEPGATNEAEMSKLIINIGDEIRRAQGESREKIELGKSMTEQQKEAHGREAIITAAVVKIQSAFRRHQLRVRARNERQQRWAELTRAATVIQVATIFRSVCRR
ncbi:hypothetical protein COOONC_00256, partial [Cooperia oncophora]